MFAPAIQVAPVVDWKNAQVCIVDKLSRFTMPDCHGARRPSFQSLRKRRSSLSSPLKNWGWVGGGGGGGGSSFRPHALPVGTLSFDLFLGCARGFFVGPFFLIGLCVRFCRAPPSWILVPILQRGPLSLFLCRSSEPAPLSATLLPTLWALVSTSHFVVAKYCFWS